MPKRKQFGKKLTPTQRVELEFLKSRIRTTELYGGNDRIKPCKRLVIRKADKGWPSKKMRNKITDFPQYLFPCHVVYMLEYNVQMPNPKIRELSHRCADPNYKKVDKQGSCANCIEPSHMNLRPHHQNKGQCHCHNAIKHYEQGNRWDPSIDTSGVILVADIPNCKISCEHHPKCLGNFVKHK